MRLRKGSQKPRHRAFCRERHHTMDHPAVSLWTSAAGLSSRSKMERRSLPQQSIKDAAENMRRDKEWIRQMDALCTSSRRELIASLVSSAMCSALSTEAGLEPVDG